MNSEKYVEKSKSRAWMLYTILALLGAFTLYFLSNLFIAISNMINWIGASVIYTIGLYFIALEGCQIAVFPGSFWLWKRAIEMNRAM